MYYANERNNQPRGKWDWLGEVAAFGFAGACGLFALGLMGWGVIQAGLWVWDAISPGR